MGLIRQGFKGGFYKIGFNEEEGKEEEEEVEEFSRWKNFRGGRIFEVEEFLKWKNISIEEPFHCEITMLPIYLLHKMEEFLKWKNF